MNEHQQLVAELAIPGETLLKRFTPRHCHALHMLVGLAGEVLELEQELRIAPDFLRSNVIEELGDIEFFLTGLYQCFDIEQKDSNPLPTACNLGHIRNALEYVITAVKRHVIYNATPDAIPQTLDAFTDILNQFYKDCSIDRDKVLQANITKLRKRYGTKYSDEAAAARRDKL